MSSENIINFITASLVEDTPRDTMAGSLQTVHCLAAQTGPRRRPFGRDHHGFILAFLDSRCCRHLYGLSNICVNLLLSALTSPLVAKLDLARPLGAEQAVPEDKEGLGEVGLDAPTLMVNVMIGGIVGSEVLQRVPGEGVAAVVVNGLDGRKGEEPHGLTVGHARNQESNASTSSIQKESLDGVVVQGAKSVGNVESVVARVEGH